MSFEINIDLDLEGTEDFIKAVEARLSEDGRKQEDSFTRQSFRAAGETLINEWIKTAESKFNHSDGSYARGIQEGLKYPFNGDPLHLKIVHTSKYAIALEEGYDQYDMKKMLSTSSKVRMSKAGKKYLIIPFKHGTPGSTSIEAMPQEVYNEAKTMKQSFIKNTFKEGVVQGAASYKEAEKMRISNPQKVKRNIYKWGDKLNSYDQYDGMVRFDANPNSVRNKLNINSLMKFGKSKQNNQAYSTYLIFRVMSEDSQGWIHPAQKPMNILGETMQRVETNIIQQIEAGFKQDVEYLRNYKSS